MNMSKLVLEGVGKRYGEGVNTVYALQDVSMRVEAGEFVAVVGPSGSGKSTLLAIAGALLQQSSGNVLINGVDISSFSPAKLAQVRLHQIGFILQSSNLVPYLKTIDQLLLVAELSGTRNRETAVRAEKLLTELGLAHRRDHYPEHLSGGERQRVAIARALMNDPDVILADEPTASLDTTRGKEVVEMLVREAKSRGKAAVMVTHDERMLHLCDRVLRMTDGKLQEVNP
ncbi:ABC transporter ATP-binding protein [Tumebacillus flagellatus]|uniref:Putative hemin import ATP-binding protein HrtA n=1 Tax=Tumebacillus flagellatus TaxID=1157490 RepID=A0A074LN18_9BACL|nr:ABC transporter ATP-binding protein [Tumebacillus flagellatus]KEO81233.1 hemin ABC transporter ATP-binding protein [Tumebacillus flagellatus]